MNTYVGYEEQALCKLGVYHGRARTGTGILGLFNVGKTPLMEVVGLSDFLGTEEGEYVLREHASGMISSTPVTRRENAVMSVSIPIQGWTILAAHPTETFEIAQKQVKVSNLGLLGKMSGPAAIIESHTEIESGERLRLRTSLKALGTLGETLNSFHHAVKMSARC